MEKHIHPVYTVGSESLVKTVIIKIYKIVLLFTSIDVPHASPVGYTAV